MIVILRRIRAAAGRVTGTDWLLIGVEGLLVFLGIVAAFQLEQWATDRREAKADARLLDRLVDEAEDTVAQLRRFRDVMGQRSEAARNELDLWLNQGQCPGEAMEFILFYPALDLPTAVYDEMIGSGGLTALPNGTARRTTARFHASRHHYRGQLEYFRRIADGKDDAYFALGYRAGFDPSQPGRDAYISTREPVPCDDPALKSLFAEMVSTFETMQRTRAGLTDDAIAMCAVLAESAGRNCTPRDVPLEGRDAQLAAAAIENME